MIDLHCHLAFGVDDGPSNASESIALAKAFVDAGVTQVACTSHLRRDKFWVNDIHVQAQNHQNLDDVLEGIPLLRAQGAEHYLDEQLLDTMKKKEVVPYTGTDWILLELPYHGPPPNLMNVLYEYRRQGYKLLLAHLERFPYVVDRSDRLDAIVSAGYAIQVNLGSLSGVYGKDYQKVAERLVVDGYASVLAGDCHQAQDVEPCIVQGRARLRKLVGESGVHTLLVDNPAKIMRNVSSEELAY